MAGPTPPSVVMGAARTPLPYGLFSTVTFRPGDRWETGVTYETLSCDPIKGIAAWDCSKTATGLPKDLTTQTGAVGGFGTGSVFTVYSHFVCSPMGWTPERAELKAREHLLTREEGRVEQALWLGDLDNDPSIIDGTEVDASVAGAGIDETIGLLEEAIASSYGSLGIIHMTRKAAIAALATGSLVTSGGRLLTALGTPVAAGGGYPGSGPLGGAPADHTTWLAATPALFGYRSEIFTSSNRSGDLLNKKTNTLYSVAERTYLLGFDPCGVHVAMATLPVITLPT